VLEDLRLDSNDDLYSEDLDRTVTPDTVRKKPKYPAGFTSADDLDGDGAIDMIESQLKVHMCREQIQDIIQQKI